MQADRLRLRLINEENIVNMGTRGGGKQKRQKRRTLVRKRQINSVSIEGIQKEKQGLSRRLIKEKNKECVKLCKSGIRRLEVKQKWSVKKEKKKKETLKWKSCITDRDGGSKSFGAAAAETRGAELHPRSLQTFGSGVFFSCCRTTDRAKLLLM